MSFSQLTKNELARFMPSQPCCIRSELAAFLVFNGSLEKRSGKRACLSVLTEMPDTARKIVTLARKGLGAETEVSVRRKERLQKNLTYLIRIIPYQSAVEVLADLALIEGESFRPFWGIPWRLLATDCCRWSFLRGAFLARGSLTDPEKSYHWEINIDDHYLGQDLLKLVELQKVKAGLVERRPGFIVYAKSADDIATLLAGMSAYSAVLALENIRVVKDVRNTVNRQVNCETANLDKTVAAALTQTMAIERLESSGKLRTLPAKLRNLAELRLEHPSASLRELGLLLDPPAGKSTVAHRMRRLVKIAEELDSS